MKTLIKKSILVLVTAASMVACGKKDDQAPAPAANPYGYGTQGQWGQPIGGGQLIATALGRLNGVDGSRLADVSLNFYGTNVMGPGGPNYAMQSTYNGPVSVVGEIRVNPQMQAYCNLPVGVFPINGGNGMWQGLNFQISTNAGAFQVAIQGGVNAATPAVTDSVGRVYGLHAVGSINMSAGQPCNLYME